MEKNLEFVVENIKYEGKVIDEENTFWVISLIYAIPHGVMAMSSEIEGLVETSTNLGVISTEGEFVKIVTSQRSSINSARDELGLRIELIGELAGCRVEHNTSYPGWKPNMDSQILKFAKKVWKELRGEEPHIKAIHAGLECGIIGERYPGMDMISFGPDMFGVHSPDEKLDSESTVRVYEFLCELLKRFAEENR
jgi:dipeptidase D